MKIREHATDQQTSAADHGLQRIRGKTRVVIENISPQVDGGRFPAKRVLGEAVQVEADVFADGHDLLAGYLLYRHADEVEWQRTPMRAVINDRWRASFNVTRLGRYRYTVCALVDPYQTWCRDLEKWQQAGQDIVPALHLGARLLREASIRSKSADAPRLAELAERLGSAGNDGLDLQELAREARNTEAQAMMRRIVDPETVALAEREYEIVVDRERARHSSWYEMFPRSCADEPGQHGTLRDCEARLPYIAEMGFDILYLPPIHPIGQSERKGKNNKAQADPDDVGSPWAIGSVAGGHKSIHPELGTLDDFKRLQTKARDHGIEIALDIAFQCSPDHPYVKEHPEWFFKRPDGSIQYAENPPKKYQDIYPFHFECEAWQALWLELKSVFDFWIGHGVLVFRVDNPHTKPFRFWEWVIHEIKREHPEVIFLAEAFTRPRVMHRLAKLGFSQSYTYFTWRNTKPELIAYLSELTREDGREYFRPNAWPNTPDILNEYLQIGGRPAFVTRLILAATLFANYGIYGPAFELGEDVPREPGSEEYLDSEKYQLRSWDIDRADSLRPLIARVNRIRREHPALQRDWSLRFHDIDNEQLIAYSKTSEDGVDTLLVVVNLDPNHVQSGHLSLPLEEFGLDPQRAFQAHDLLSEGRYLWHGARNFVSLDPQGVAAHIFRLRRHTRSERDFDYFN